MKKRLVLYPSCKGSGCYACNETGYLKSDKEVERWQQDRIVQMK